MGMQPERLRIELVQEYIKDFNDTLIESEEEFDFDKDQITQDLVDSINVELKDNTEEFPSVLWNALSDEDIVPEEFHDRFVKFMAEQLDEH